MVRFRKKGCNWGKGDSRRDSRKQCKKAVRKSDPEKQCKETIRRSNPKKQSEKAIRKSNARKPSGEAMQESDPKKRSVETIFFFSRTPFEFPPFYRLKSGRKTAVCLSLKTCAPFSINLSMFFKKHYDAFGKTLRCFLGRFACFFLLGRFLDPLEISLARISLRRRTPEPGNPLIGPSLKRLPTLEFPFSEPFWGSFLSGNLFLGASFFGTSFWEFPSLESLLKTFLLRKHF